ncbi:MAG TPA: ABC transporter permease subunit [Streptosporangiaceae bacterium]|nr:ABC transporter permease subunit [Streptosporangiaceae bacterium]
MIWLSWRQFRTQAIVAGGVLAALAIAMLATGFSLAHLYQTSGLPGCQAKNICHDALVVFNKDLTNSVYEFIFYIAIGLLYLTPALIGAFWGAPLVAREAETGTIRLAWSQSVSRRRWLIAKVAMLGLAGMAMAGVASLMLYWWSQPAYEAAKVAAPETGLSISRLTPLLFGTNGVAPLGYAAFAFAVGLTASVLIKRTLPAMAVTLAVVALVLIAWPNWVRPHLITPVRSTVALEASAIKGLGISSNTVTLVTATSKPGAWVLSDQAVNAAGQQFAAPPPHGCLTESYQACTNAILGLHLKEAISFEPASRFWALQGFETGAYLLIALALAAACTWWLNRRRLA